MRSNNSANTPKMPDIQIMQAASVNTNTQELPRTNQAHLSSEKNNKAASSALINEIKQIVLVLEANDVDCADIKIRLDKNSPQLTNHDLRLIYRAFKRLACQYKSLDKNITELCQLSFIKLRFFWFSFVRNIESEHAYQKLKPYGEPGAYLGHAVSAGLNASVGLGIANELNATASAGLTIFKERMFTQDDEACFLPEGNISLCSLTAGVNIGAQMSEDLGLSANAGLSGRYFRQTGYQYPDVQDYVKRKGFIRIKRDPLSFKGKVSAFFKGKLTRNDYIKANQAALNADTRLKSLLSSLNQSQTTSFVQVEAPERQLGMPYTVNGAFFDLNAAANATLNLDLGGVSVAQGAGARIVQEAKFLDLSEKVKFNLLDFEKEQERDENVDLSKPKSSLLTPNWLFKISEFNQGEEFHLEDLKESLQAYYKCVNEYDWCKKEGQSFSSKAEINALRQIKREIEANWGASGRHQLLQHMWMALVYLKHINQIKNEQDPHLQSFIAELTKPNIKHNHQRLNDIAFAEYTVPLKIIDFRSEIELSLSQFKGKIELLHRTRKHPNLLREGKYLDISITGEASVSFADLFGSDEFMSALNSFIALAGVELPTDFALSPDINVGGSLSYKMRFFKPKYAENEDYQGEKGWKPQVNRLFTSTFSGTHFTASSPITLGANLSGVLGCQSVSTKQRKETVCPEDPIYTLLRCVRFYRNSHLHNPSQQKDPNSPEWQLFYQERKSEINQLFKNLANPDHHAAKEIDYLATHYGKLDLTAFNQVMRDFAQDANKEEAACLAFTQLAKDLTKPIVEIHRSRWKRMSFNKGVNSGLSFGQKVRKKLEFGVVKDLNKAHENKAKNANLKNEINLNSVENETTIPKLLEDAERWQVRSFR